MSNASSILKIRQIAYNIFEYIKQNPNKKITKEQFEPSTLNPSNDKKVVIGILRSETNLSNEDINELIQEANINEKVFYDIYNRLEKHLNIFFNKEVNDLKDGSGITNDMDLSKFQGINKEELEIKDDKQYALDLETFTDMVLEKKKETIEITVENREKKYFVIEFNDLANFWRYNTPEYLIFEDFIQYLINYRLASEEHLLLDIVILNSNKCFIVNSEIAESKNEEEEIDFDF